MSNKDHAMDSSNRPGDKYRENTPKKDRDYEESEKGNHYPSREPSRQGPRVNFR